MRWLCEITVSTRAMDFRTTLLQQHRPSIKPCARTKSRTNPLACLCAACGVLLSQDGSTLSVIDVLCLAAGPVVPVTIRDGLCKKRTHIFESLLGAPPVTFATLSAPSSCFSSFSCAWRSDLLLSRSSCALSLAARAPTDKSCQTQASCLATRAIQDLHLHIAGGSPGAASIMRRL